MLELLSRCGGPDGLARAGRRQVSAVDRKNAPRAGQALADEAWLALAEQAVVVPATKAAEAVLPRLTDTPAQVLAQRRDLATEVEEILDAHPLAR